MENKATTCRQSNLELLRIFAMLLIIAHHFVIHSGLLSQPGPIYSVSSNWKTYFFICFGAFGKTAINCFVLITGYFMCKQETTFKKYLKLFFEVALYRVVIGIVLACLGMKTFFYMDYVKMVIPFSTIGTLFIDSFLAFYLLIPFLNIVVKNTSAKQLRKLCILLLSIFTILGSIKLPDIRITTMNYVAWFITLYFVASCIRLYPKKIFDNTRVWAIISVILFLLANLSVIFCYEQQWQDIYYFVSDSNVFLAFVLGLSLFLTFKNLKIKQHRWINILAQGTLAVLLIHDDYPQIRHWIWYEAIDVQKIYSMSYSPLRALLTILGIFVVCSLIDQLRIHLIEHKVFSKIK